ncbi:P3 protein [Lamellibrachia satsuma]|nr:P3 protein [Lamellibrachia satsuma]
MGRTSLECRIDNGVRGRDNVTIWTPLQGKYKIAVIREPHVLYPFFLGLVFILVLCVNIGMGCALDLEVVKTVLRRPVAPAIGFFSQFLVMPILAYSMVRLFGFTHDTALGYFAIGCAPGGGKSNIYTFLFNGDVSLSVTMTFVSVIASLAMLPLWLLTLVRIASSLLTVMVPLAIGIFIRRFRPSVADVISKILRPFSLFVIIVVLPIALYMNIAVIRMFTVAVVLAGCCLPYVGFLLGAVLAAVCRQSRARIITIALETGIQNIGLPILVIQHSLPHPESDIAMIGPIAVAIATPLPLWLGLAIQEVRRRCCRGPPEVTSDQDTNEAPYLKDTEVGEKDVEANEDLLAKTTPTTKV